MGLTFSNDEGLQRSLRVFAYVKTISKATQPTSAPGFLSAKRLLYPSKPKRTITIDEFFISNRVEKGP